MDISGIFSFSITFFPKKLFWLMVLFISLTWVITFFLLINLVKISLSLLYNSNILFFSCNSSSVSSWSDTNFPELKLVFDLFSLFFIASIWYSICLLTEIFMFECVLFISSSLYFLFCIILCNSNIFFSNSIFFISWFLFCKFNSFFIFLNSSFNLDISLFFKL